MSDKNHDQDQEEYFDDQDRSSDEGVDADMTDQDEVDLDQAPTDKYDRLTAEDNSHYKVTGMYKDWFIDYASYVILERSVPHLEDGLKPVQRRILHAMRRSEDGRYNKVAAIVGDTMHFHPHGDASIGDALVQLGQKNLLIDCQGNWGNILTGDGAAASRYIEARLTKFALEVVFNPKTTEWMLSYDGRSNEPVTLPVKFPLLLAQGADGIAVTLTSKILPHNFNELCDAAVDYLNDRPFELYPDFQTGGLIDCTRYADGLRGGSVKVRARISKLDKRTLVITEIPFTTTTETIKDSIVRAAEKGKIKIKKVDDMTSDKVEITVHISNDEPADKIIDALYAFTACETSISPSACVVYNNRPCFIGVSEILRRSVDRTRELLGNELKIRLNELADEWHNCSLERIFIENRLYDLMHDCKSPEEVYAVIDRGLEPFKKLLLREVVNDDVVRLTRLQFMRIPRFSATEADNKIKAIEAEQREVNYNLDHLTDYTIAHFNHIKERYGAGRERKTEIRVFDQIEVQKVAVVNSKLYVDRKGGFYGIGKQMSQLPDAEYVCDCSDLDEVIAFTDTGHYTVRKVSDKFFFEQNIYWIGVFKRNDERTIYNILYRDGLNGAIMKKRCAIKGINRDKTYDITKGTAGSRLLYMSVNANGEAETIKVFFRQRTKLKKSIVELDFSTLAIKGRGAQGNIFSHYAINKIVLKSKGASTLSGQNIWFDEDVMRLNTDGHGVLLGEFEGDEKIIVFTDNNQYYTTGYDVGHHFPDGTVRVEKYDQDRVYSVVYWDEDQKYYYIKRFAAEQDERMQPFIEGNTRLVAITDSDTPLLDVVYGGTHAARPDERIDVTEFIGVKSHRAKGKRVTTLPVESLGFAPVKTDEQEQEQSDDNDTDESDDNEQTQGREQDSEEMDESESAETPDESDDSEEDEKSEESEESDETEQTEKSAEQTAETTTEQTKTPTVPTTEAAAESAAAAEKPAIRTSKPQATKPIEVVELDRQNDPTESHKERYRRKKSIDTAFEVISIESPSNAKHSNEQVVIPDDVSLEIIIPGREATVDSPEDEEDTQLKLF